MRIWIGIPRCSFWISARHSPSAGRQCPSLPVNCGGTRSWHVLRIGTGIPSQRSPYIRESIGSPHALAFYCEAKSKGIWVPSAFYRVQILSLPPRLHKTTLFEAPAPRILIGLQSPGFNRYFGHPLNPQSSVLAINSFSTRMIPLLLVARLQATIANSTILLGANQWHRHS